MNPLKQHIVEILHNAVTGNEASYTDWWLEKQRNRKEAWLEISGERVFVRGDVFLPDPCVTYSTSMALSALGDLKGQRVIDIGTGCGIIALKALRSGADFVNAVDIEAACVANATQNLRQFINEGRASVCQQNLFGNTQEKFDCVVANLPITDGAWPGIKAGTMAHFERFFAGLPEHLNPNGRCLLVFASFGDVNGLCEILTKIPFDINIRTAWAFGVNWHVLELHSQQ